MGGLAQPNGYGMRVNGTSAVGRIYDIGGMSSISILAARHKEADMTDFIAAFRSGLNAAEKADLARKEIASVFRELNEQLRDPTQGRVEIITYEFEGHDDNFFGIGISSRYSATYGRAPTHWAVAARNPKAADTKPRELASWQQDRAGYPCTLSWGGLERRGNDRESLQAALAAMLEDGIVAGRINGVMRLPDAKPTVEEAVPTA